MYTKGDYEQVFLHKMQMSVHVLHQYSSYKLYSSIVEEGGG